MPWGRADEFKHVENDAIVKNEFFRRSGVALRQKVVREKIVKMARNEAKNDAKSRLN